MLRKRIARFAVLALLAAACVAGTFTYSTQVAQHNAPSYQLADPGSSGSTGG
jgi:hypothetical protein